MIGASAAGDYVSMVTGSPSIVLDFMSGGPADKGLATYGEHPLYMSQL